MPGFSFLSKDQAEAFTATPWAAPTRENEWEGSDSGLD
jgi:hypothetical protein